MTDVTGLQSTTGILAMSELLLMLMAIGAYRYAARQPTVASETSAGARIVTGLYAFFIAQALFVTVAALMMSLGS